MIKETWNDWLLVCPLPRERGCPGGGAEVVPGSAGEVTVQASKIHQQPPHTLHTAHHSLVTGHLHLQPGSVSHLSWLFFAEWARNFEAQQTFLYLCCSDLQY